MDELVSVIITTHNRNPAILKRAIDSVCSQLYQNIEIYIVDDSPTYDYHDEIVELTKQYNTNITYIVNKTHPGACGSRNLGIMTATGKYIALLDDDDEWVPEKLSWMLDKFEDDIAIVYGKYTVSNNRNNRNTNKDEIHYEGNVFEKLLLYGNFIGGCSVPIFKKNKAMEIGLFDENLKSAQDYDFWLRLSRKNRVCFVNKNVVNYYLSDDAISTSPNRKIESAEYLLNKYRDDFEHYPEAKKRVFKEILYRLACSGQYKKSFVKYRDFNVTVTSKEYIKLLAKGFIKRMVLMLHLQNR